MQYNKQSNITVHKLGVKTITIKTLQQEKFRISVILIYKSLLKLEFINNKNYYIKDIIKDLIEKIYIIFFKNIISLNKALLIFVHSKMHVLKFLFLKNIIFKILII